MSAEEARERLGLDADAKSRAVVVPDDAQLSVDLQGYQELQMVGVWGLQMVGVWGTGTSPCRYMNCRQCVLGRAGAGGDHKLRGVR